MLLSFCRTLPWHTWDFTPLKWSLHVPELLSMGTDPQLLPPRAVLGLGAAGAALHRGSAILGAARH